MLINAVAWFTYGILAVDTATVIVSTLQVVCGVRYIAIFIAHTTERNKAYQTLCAGASLLLIYGVVGIGSPVSARIARLGALAAVATLMMYIAPLSRVPELLRQNTSSDGNSSVPLPLMLLNTAAAAMWGAHGVTNHDMWIAVPSLVGAISMTCVLTTVFVLRWKRQFQVYRSAVTI